MVVDLHLTDTHAGVTQSQAFTFCFESINILYFFQLRRNENIGVHVSISEPNRKHMSSEFLNHENMYEAIFIVVFFLPLHF